MDNKNSHVSQAVGDDVLLMNFLKFIINYHYRHAPDIMTHKKFFDKTIRVKRNELIICCDVSLHMAEVLLSISQRRSNDS